MTDTVTDRDTLGRMEAELRAELERNLARAMRRAGVGGLVQMDNATRNGAVMVDPDHEANAAQNSLGSFMPSLARKGYLTSSGHSEASQAPGRRGGKQSVWIVTVEGMVWARGKAPRLKRKRD
jgi:hypothetical protein